MQTDCKIKIAKEEMMDRLAVTGIANGLYVSLAFDNSRSFGRFLNDLPPTFGEPWEAPDTHASVMYPEELVDAGLSAAEQAILPDVAKDIAGRLGQLGLVGQQVDITPGIIKPFKKFYGLEIEDEELLDGVRGVTADAVSDGVGVNLGNFLREYHVSIARRRPGDGRRKPIEYRKRNFPRKLTIAGINVGVRTVQTNSNSHQQYTNRGRHGADPGRFYS